MDGVDRAPTGMPGARLRTGWFPSRGAMGVDGRDETRYQNASPARTTTAGRPGPPSGLSRKSVSHCRCRKQADESKRREKNPPPSALYTRIEVYSLLENAYGGLWVYV